METLGLALKESRSSIVTVVMVVIRTIKVILLVMKITIRITIISKHPWHNGPHFFIPGTSLGQCLPAGNSQSRTLKRLGAML